MSTPAHYPEGVYERTDTYRVDVPDTMPNRAVEIEVKRVNGSLVSITANGEPCELIVSTGAHFVRRCSYPLPHDKCPACYVERLCAAPVGRVRRPLPERAR